jgi:hypothetical protein
MRNREDANAVTGEWLIFAKHGDFKYILSLAGHKEGINRREGDQKICDRICRSCGAEFPFLFPGKIESCLDTEIAGMLAQLADALEESAVPRIGLHYRRVTT